MSRIIEQPHELIVLFWSILSINILQNTNDIDQCEKIDIKMLPSTDKINETYTCTDAFVKLNFYQGNYRSGTLNSNTVNSKFHLIRSFFEILATILSFHV